MTIENSDPAGEGMGRGLRCNGEGIRLAEAEAEMDSWRYKSFCASGEELPESGEEVREVSGREMLGLLVDWVEGVQRTRRLGVGWVDRGTGSEAVVCEDSFVFWRSGGVGRVPPTAMSSCAHGRLDSSDTGGIGEWRSVLVGENEVPPRLSSLVNVSKLPKREETEGGTGVLLLELKSGISRVKANRSAMGSGIIGTGGGASAASGVDPFFDPLEEPIRNSERFFLSET